MKFLTKRTLATVLAIAILSFLAGNLSNGLAKSDRAEVLRNLEKFSLVYQKIIRNYVDEEDSDELIDAAIRAMIEELDPFSQYLDEDQVEDLMVKTKGEFGGLGIIISKKGDYPTVISPIDDTPAARLGIRGGDKIVEIEGESTEGWSVQDAVDKLRGPKGTAVDIGISRFGVEEVLPYHIVRDIISVKSVPYAFVLEDDIGYIRVSNFGEKTADELRAALDELEAEGIDGLILDLRNNPGGLLESARQVSDLFLGAGHVIVSTRGRGEKRLQEIYAQSNVRYAWDYPLVVMINENSASASEIVAGAVQDWDRGLVVGRNSFGKGSVQSIFSVSDKEALKLTTAKYYTPSGRCIHRDENNHRFAADASMFEIGDAEEEAPVGDDHPEYELETPAESPVSLDSLPLFETLKLHRTVRGGGGIMPDIIMEYEKISNQALDLERRSAFFDFAVELVAEREVEKDFKVDEALLERFQSYLAEQGVELEPDDFATNEEYIRMAIRREVLYKQFDSKVAYRSTLYMDRPLQETLALLKGESSLETLLARTEMESSELETTEAEAIEVR